MKILSLRMPDDVHERLREQAHVERTTITALILKSLECTKNIERIQPNFGWPIHE